MNLTGEAMITVTQPCQTCGGAGQADHLLRQWCRVCGKAIEQGWFEGKGTMWDNANLPCGHAGFVRAEGGRVIDNVCESDLCPDCEGEGSFTGTATLRELAAALAAMKAEVCR